MSNINHHHIYQIFWNEGTRSSNDQGFLQLNNLSNERPDWSEYWPIRTFLRHEYLLEDTYYGFFSPKFLQKTGLTSTDVYKFLESATEDVVTFSPFFDQSSFAINLFEQAAANHKNIYPTLKESVSQIMPDVNIDTLVMTSRTSVFCNYFVAKKDFWIRWIHECEKVFSLCEDGKMELARKLNAEVNHSGGKNPAKVFLIERVASLLLATSRRWTVKNYDSLQLPMATSKVAHLKAELITFDSLKKSYIESRNLDVLKTFSQMRTDVMARLV